jgi:hypothetical protein
MLYIFFGDYEAVCGDDLLFQQVLDQLKEEGYTITYRGALFCDAAAFEVKKKQQEEAV